MHNGQVLDVRAPDEQLSRRPEVYPVQRRGLNPWAWRIALVLSLLTVAAAALLTAAGERALSDMFITFAFTLGLLTAPLWLFAERASTR